MPLKVYAGGSIEKLSGKLAGKGDFELVSLPAAGFVKPSVGKFARLEIPDSIKREPQEHNVQVGVVLSAKGEVLATCIVSSDCPQLEQAAERQMRATKFVPAKLEGAAVPAFVVFPVSYRYQALK